MYGNCRGETIKTLINHGAHINHVNDIGEAPLLLVCKSAQDESVRILLKANADPNIADTDGDASRHGAVAADCSGETLHDIIDHGADVNAISRRGRTPLLLSCFYRQIDLVNVLLGSGADPAVADEEGFSCLHTAVDGRCSTDTLQTLIENGAHIDAKRKDGTNALLCACRTGQSESVKFLLETGADVNIVKPDGNTTLHVAVNGDCNKETLQQIIHKGVDINAVNSRGQTSLQCACYSAQIESVKLLLANGADPNISNAAGSTSLHAAVYGNCTDETLHAIIKHMQATGKNKAYLDAQNIKFQTALFLACLYRKQNSVMILLEAGSNPNIADYENNTSLHAAVFGGCSKKIIKALIDHGAYVNCTNKLKRTGLMLSCWKGNVNTVNVLLEAGAYPNIADVDRNTCLQRLVIHACSIEVLQTIIDHGALVNATNKKGCTALMMACQKGNADGIILLLKSRADLNIADADGHTCLQCLVLHGCSVGLLQTIIDHGTLVNATNKKGHTALMMASQQGNIDGITLLLKAGADSNIADVDGNTCLQCFIFHKCSTEVLQTIIDHGVDVDATNKNGVTALMMASEKANVEFVNVLLNAGADPCIAIANGDKCLHISVIQGCSIDVLQTLIDHGVDVNATNKNSVTALMIASEEGNVEFINVLLKAGADASIGDVNGRTWLHHSMIRKCKREVLQMIIDHGAQVNATNKMGHTVLMLASAKGNIDGINVLLTAGADPSIEDANGNTWLHHSIIGECKREVLQMMIDCDAQVNTTNKMGHTALMLASGKANIDGINILLKAGADPGIEDANGNTWLHHSVIGCSIEVLETLIDYGVDLNATNKKCHTALMMACDKGNIDGINVLMKAGADPNIVDADGYNCLHFVVLRGCSIDVLQKITEHGADVNAVNKNGVTSLMMASEKGNVDFINVLLKDGADINIADADGDTCLHISVLQGCSIEVLQTLIDHGVDVNAIDEKGDTALMLASEKGNVEFIYLLLKAGADPNIADGDGNTWLHHSIIGESKGEVLQMIINHGAQVNATNKMGDTALMIASGKGNVDGTNVLLEAGADPNITDANEDSCIHISMLGFYKRQVLQTVINHGVKVNDTNKQSYTALMIASLNGNIDGIKVLLEAGADPNIADVNGYNCLHFVVFQGCSIDVLQTIIDHGVDVNATNKMGHTALMIASGKGNIDGANVLLKAGTDPSIGDANGNIWLHHSIIGDCKREVLQKIIYRNSQVNATNKKGHTALMIACAKGNIDGINVLLEAGAGPNVTDTNGNTCLHISVFRGCSTEVLEALIDHGADVNATNRDHENAIMLAYKEGNTDTIDILMTAGSI